MFWKIPDSENPRKIRSCCMLLLHLAGFASSYCSSSYSMHPRRVVLMLMHLCPRVYEVCAYVLCILCTVYTDILTV